MNTLNFKLLLDQVSGDLNRIGINTLLKYYNKIIDSIFDKVNTNFRNALNYIRNSVLINKSQLDENKSKRFEQELSKKIISKFYGNVYISKKYMYSYSFFGEKVLLKGRLQGSYIPYIRVGFFEDTKSLLNGIKKKIFKPRNLLSDFDDFYYSFKDVLIDTVEHDDFDISQAYMDKKRYKDYSETEVPLFTPVLYLKIRPFVVNNKKVIIIEEIQSTIIATINHFYTGIYDHHHYEGFSEDLSKFFEPIALKYLRETINLLKEECDALYIVRTAVPKNQRFLYKDYEQYYCKSPTTNKKFINFISLIYDPEKININPDNRYQYLYCLKELEDENMFKQFNLNLLNDLILKYKVVDYKHAIPDHNDKKILNSLFLKEAGVLGVDLNKYSAPRFECFYQADVEKGILIIAGVISFRNSIRLSEAKKSGELIDIQRIVQKSNEYEQMFSKKLREIGEQIISPLSQERSVLGVSIKPRVKLKEIESEVVEEFFMDIGLKFEFEFKVPIENIFKRVGLKL